MPRRVRAESRSRYYIRTEAEKRGWDTRHVAAGGDFLEENEIAAHFENTGLGLQKPDFLICLRGDPAAAVETKNEADKLDQAVAEAIGYADLINNAGYYFVRVAIGAAGEQDKGFSVRAMYRTPGGWVPLTSFGHELTTVPPPPRDRTCLRSQRWYNDCHSTIDCRIRRRGT